jgi:hypothetical protein
MSTIDMEPMDYEEVDTLIETMRSQNEMNDYVFHDILPDFVVQARKKGLSLDARYFPNDNYNISGDDILEPCAIDISADVALLENMRGRCMDIEQELHELENASEKDNECPVCMEDITGKSYFTGKCGHKFCSPCIVENMCVNKHTGNKCPMCRQTFM